MEDEIPLTSEHRQSKTSAISESFQSIESPKPTDKQLSSHFRVFGVAWEDVKYTYRYIRDQNSRHIWTHVGLFVFLLASLISSTLIGLLTGFGNNEYCDPGGNFNFARTYDPWAREHTFQITLGLGRLTFTQAKVIDVVWDVVVGRGGQFLLAAVCFHVFSKTLNLMLEQPKASMSYDAFRAIVFERPSLSSTTKLARDLGSTRGWRSKASIIWMVIASIYVVAFPTMISAMTGYSANVDPYFDNGTGSKIPVPENFFQRVVFRVYNADRIEGLQLNETYLVGSRGFAYSTTGDADSQYFACIAGYIARTNESDCGLALGLAQYRRTYGADATLTDNATLSVSTILNYTVVAPGLTIETFNTVAYSPSSYGTYTRQLSDLNSTAPPMYKITDDTNLYNATYINNGGGTCDSKADYLWGFSFILLFAFLFVSGVWVLGMYAMWIDVRRNSRLERAGRKMGFYRGAVDINNAMWKDMLREPGELMSETKIRKMLAQKMNGGRVTFDEIRLDDLPPSRKADFRRFKQNVPSINGWTKAWTALHWLWFFIFALAGFVWFVPILALITDDPHMVQFVLVFSLIIAGILWLGSLVMLTAAVPGLAQLYRHIPFLNRRLRPQRTAHWIWTVVLTVSGGLAFFVAVAVSTYSTSSSESSLIFGIGYTSTENLILALLVINLVFAGLLWLPAAIMVLTGLFCIPWRWIVQLKRIMARSAPKHTAVPQAEQDTSYSAHSVENTGPE